MTDTNQIHIFGIDTMEDLQEASKIFHSEIAKFGTVVASTEIQKIPDEIWENLLINRHFLGDWGDLPPEDKEVNDAAYKDESGGWILSCYKNAYKGRDIWIETHGYGISKDVMDLDKYSVEDYNHTVVMFPEER
tara:strand:- start:124 stop:525 length:402 start_codon:yes stop_codon:yes gene_type:complete